MGINQQSIKLLWGRAGSRCSFPTCRKELTQSASSGTFLIGEQAHIVGEKNDAPRGKSILTLEERNSYPNLILLCPTHHKEIDKNQADYPVERLYILKSEHEDWVRNSLSKQEDLRQIVNDSIYTALIDASQLACPFGEWDTIVRNARMEPPIWYRDADKWIFNFRIKVFQAIWPNTLPELENALKTFSTALHEMMNVFRQHTKRVERDDDMLYGIAFFADDRYFRPNLTSEEETERRHYLIGKFDTWLKSYNYFLMHVVKSANWLADVVRRDINPAFYAISGKFLYPIDIDEMFDLLEYSDEEKSQLPEKLEKEIHLHTYKFHD